MFERLGSFAVRRRRRILATWALVLVLGVAAGGAVFGRTTSDVDPSDRAESRRADARLWHLDPDGGTIHAIATGERAGLAAAADRVRALDGVRDVAGPVESPDHEASALEVTLTADLDDDAALAVAHRAADVLHATPGATVRVGGDVLQDDEFATGSERDLRRGESIALPVALAVLVLVFGGVVAAGLPVVLALAGVAGAFLLLLASTVFGDVSVYAINVVTMFGLGLGIDYGLLLVGRFREERAAGTTVDVAVERTVATAGVTVGFSALTVAAALCGLFVFDVPAFRSMAVGGIGVVLTAMVAGLTLLPALLATIGRRIRPARRGAADDHGWFARVSHVVQRRAVPIVALVAGGLAVLALPFLGVRFQRPDARALAPSSPSRQLVDTYTAHWPNRSAGRVTVVAEAGRDDPAVASWLRAVGRRPEVASVATSNPTAATTVVDVTPHGETQGEQAQSLVRWIRAHRPSFPTLVTGDAAELLDFRAAMLSRLPLALTIIAAATLVLLFLMTGSVVVPLKAVVMNVLSLGATFGAMVWLFQDGHLSGLLGFTPLGGLDVIAPVLIAVFAFGLSMDYEVFLLSRIKEAWDETGDNDRAVAVGLQRTGRIITSAALLMVVVFAGFAAGELVVIKQFGVGLGLAVLVDATVVRTLLVPATMKLLGRWNWWAPAPLRRVHERFGLREPSPPPAATAGEAATAA
jgi:RND superfamily putative drug exporter